MKRIVCLILVVSIACAGCYDVEIDKITDKPISEKQTEVTKQNKEPISEKQTEVTKQNKEPISEKQTEVTKQNKELSKVNVIHLPPAWETPGDHESNAVLRLKNARLEMEIDRVKNMLKQNEAALESQRAVSRAILVKWEGEQSKGKIMHKKNKTLLVRIDGLEAAIESQRTEIERSKNVYHSYEAAIKFQMIVEKTEKALLAKIAGLEDAL
jgi:hypothetical protein